MGTVNLMKEMVRIENCIFMLIYTFIAMFLRDMGFILTSNCVYTGIVLTIAFYAIMSKQEWNDLKKRLLKEKKRFLIFHYKTFTINCLIAAAFNGFLFLFF